ncbi:MAG TPA: Rho termination factor N-terminal domain-containing protein, partial [Solirubrobacterales bacterium]|nr:Rho termination factor N-terminal domain-containing protein [Solirubrobacterales bacterium]
CRPMTKTELEKKHLSDLHLLASEAGIDKYRLLTKAELVDRLAESGGNGDGAKEQTAARSERPERPRRRRRGEGREPREPRDRPEKAPEREPAPEPAAREKREETPEPPPASEPAEAPRPRRRRRRRFGRRRQGVTLQTLLLPPEAGRQALVFAESREGCTELLRGVAADLAADSKGPDPVALLIDPSPEELADWKRDAPQAEIVSAGQPRHASDALAQAAARAGKGEDVILLVDSLTRLGEAHGDAEAAKEFFDAGRAQGSAGGGSLTVVAALERPSD